MAEQRALEGEVVGHDDGGKEKPRAGRRTWYTEEEPETYEDLVRQVVHAWVAGWTYGQIKEKYGVERNTVRNWVDAARDKNNITAPEIGRARAEVALDLKVAAGHCWTIVRTYPGTKIALEALARIESIARTLAALQGLNAPARVEVQHTEVTQEDLELQEMINEARAKSDQRQATLRADFEQRGVS